MGYGGLKSCFALALALAALAIGAPASSAATWQPCVDAGTPIDCATYELPIDRSGAVPGNLKVRALRVQATEGPPMGTIFVIAGGPGQTSLALADMMNTLFEGANRYDVIAVDQRGSGSSQPLNCPRIESPTTVWDGSDPKSDKPLTACSVALGPARGSYNTAEAVADLEAVRADLGVESATFFGVSYGTKVALAYAKAHPSHTKALLLDSVLPTDMPGAFDVDSMTALRSALTEICHGGRCKSTGGNPASGILKLARQLDRAPISTLLFDAASKPEEATIDASALYNIVLQADFNPFVYNQLPGAVSSALIGRTAQLERLFAIVNGSYFGDVQRPKRSAESLAEFSNTMFFATTCADLTPPWPRGFDVTGRQTAIDAAAQAIPDSSFLPFTRKTVRDNSTAAYCRGWQQSPTPPAIDNGPLPDIPALALNGTLDLRTPVAWAERAIAGDPSAQLVKIPASGHSVIGTDTSGCALSLAKRFLIFGATDGKCKRQAPPLPIAAKVPGSVNAVRPFPGSCRKLNRKACRSARKSLTAGYLAMRDAFDQMLIGGGDVGPGLLGGTWSVEYDLDLTTFGIVPIGIRLKGLESVPGVLASGSLSLEDMPRVFDFARFGRYRVMISGKIAEDRAGDQLRITGRSRGKLVSIRITPSLRARATAARPTAKRIGMRRSYRLATAGPSRPLGR